MMVHHEMIRRVVIAAAFGLAVGLPSLAGADIDKSSGNGYEIWEINGMEVYDLSDGETLSNILVDQTGSGNTLTIRSRNKDGWTVKNIGFKGVGTDGGGSNSFQFQVSTSSGGSGLIENVWMNNKTRNGEQADVLGGIFLRSSHAGHIDIRHTWIEGFGNNAVYGSSVGKDGGNEGSIAIENAYHRDNTVSQFRIGAPDSIVRNSVAVVDDPQGKRGSYPSSDSKNARGIWGKHFRGQRVEDSAFYLNSDDVNVDGAFEARYISDRSHGPEAVLEIVDCDINSDAPSVKESTSNARVDITNLGHNPSVNVIKGGGVPTSATMAARGNREMPPELPGADGDDEMLPKTLHIDASDAGRADYQFTVDGDLQQATDLDPIEADDELRGASADGAVDGEADGYRFSGSITEFRLISEATVSVDGESVDPEMLGEHYPHPLQIDGRDADWTDYEFTVDDAVIEYDHLGGMGADDEITGRTAEGFVNGGTDGYAYAGAITDFQLDGDATVYVDGQEWSPEECCGSEDVGIDTGIGDDTGTTADTGGHSSSRDTGMAGDAGGTGGGASEAGGTDDDGTNISGESASGCRATGSSPAPRPSHLVIFALVCLVAGSRHPTRRRR